MRKRHRSPNGSEWIRKMDRDIFFVPVQLWEGELVGFISANEWKADVIFFGTFLRWLCCVVCPWSQGYVKLMARSQTIHPHAHEWMNGSYPTAVVRANSVNLRRRVKTSPFISARSSLKVQLSTRKKEVTQETRVFIGKTEQLVLTDRFKSFLPARSRSTPRNTWEKMNLG